MCDMSLDEKVEEKLDKGTLRKQTKRSNMSDTRSTDEDER